jgi:osmoprotectant transport system permease protein
VDALVDALGYARDRQDQLVEALGQHLWLSGLALAAALGVCLPLGVWIARRRSLAEPTIAVFNGLRVVPSLAILFLAIPYLGTGAGPAVVALTALACPPILLNTYAGFRGIDAAVLEAARGMGMAEAQALRRVELPLAAPVVLAGVRAATVEVIASATLAAFIGAGGLGVFITRGFAVRDSGLMLVGAVTVALLALAAETLLGAAERAVRPVA